MKSVEKPSIIQETNKLIIKPLAETNQDKLIIKSEILSDENNPQEVDPDKYLWNRSLPGCGYNVVSVLANNGDIYAGSNGYVYKLDSNGKILATNNLPGRGSHEVRLAITDSYLVVGTSGYVVLISLSDFSNTNSNINISLPGCGYDVVSVLANKRDIYAGSNGYVYKLNSKGKILATNNLPERGSDEVRLAITDSYLVVGTSGYIVLIPLSDFDKTSSNINVSLPGCGYDVVSVLANNGDIYAGSNGYVYKLDSSGKILATNNLPGRGNHEVRLAINDTYLIAGTSGYSVLVTLSIFNDTDSNINVSLPGSGYYVVSVLTKGPFIFSGSNGYAYQQSGKSGEIMVSYGLAGLGNHEVRIDVITDQLYVGTNGSLAATEKIVVLDVNKIGQQTNMWCWAASGQMIMEYLGKNISQCEQANDRFKLNNCCITPTPSNCIRAGWPDFSNWGFESQQTDWGTALTFDQLIAQFHLNKPVAFSWGWNGGGGHMMVAKGYSELSEMVSINDPWPANEGESKWISYGAYVNGVGYTHWKDYYNISQVAILEKQKDMKTRESSKTSITFFSSKEAAKDGLNRLLYLTKNDFKGFGLEKPLSIKDNLEIDEFLKVYFIRHDALKEYEEKNNPLALLVDLNEQLYPVFLRDKVICSVTVLQSQGNQWEVKTLGDFALIREVNSVKKSLIDNPECFIVTIPSLYYLFLAYLDDKRILKFVHVYDNVIKGFKKNQVQNASEVLSIIKQDAIEDQFPLIKE
jgi:hypothetical protein